MADKLQREVDEILSQLEGFPPKRSLRSRLRAAPTSFWRGLTGLVASLPRPHVSVGQVLLLGAALIIIAWVFNPGGPNVTRMVIGAGLAIFILAFVFSLRRQSRTTEKRWRGEPMELGEPGVSTRIRSWWERWRSRR
jgi:VIT1/CCC1 family predicted Fe2+/Mn2+ transporter